MKDRVRDALADVSLSVARHVAAATIEALETNEQRTIGEILDSALDAVREQQCHHLRGNRLIYDTDYQKLDLVVAMQTRRAHRPAKHQDGRSAAALKPSARVP